MVLESYTKPANMHPAPETISVTDWYTFNLNPKDTYQEFEETDIRRHHQFKDKMIRLLNTWLKPYCNSYVFNIEISQGVRLHLHGKFQFKDSPSIVRFYLSGLHHLMGIGTTKMEKIKDAEISNKEKYATWDAYMSKQFTIWQWINFDPVITMSSVVNKYNLSEQLEFGVEKPEISGVESSEDEAPKLKDYNITELSEYKVMSRTPRLKGIVTTHVGIKDGKDFSKFINRR